MYGIRLRGLRKEKGWTIEEVAEKIGIGKSTYAGYEKELRQPPIEKILKLSQLFDVSVDYILGVSNEKDIKKIDTNVQEYLKRNDLHWNDKPLNDEDLSPIRDLLEIVVRDRLPRLMNGEHPESEHHEQTELDLEDDEAKENERSSSLI